MIDVSYRCPFDKLPCGESICSLGYCECHVMLKIGSYGICPRYVVGVDVSLCVYDKLPCNRFVDGVGSGVCSGGELCSKLVTCCHRFGGKSVKLVGDLRG